MDNDLERAWQEAGCEERKAFVSYLARAYGVENLKHSVDICGEEDGHEQGSL